MSSENEKKFDDNMRGALFAIPEEVRLKRGGKKAPAYEGRLMIDGKEYRLTGWKRYAQSTGKPYLTLTVLTAEEHERKLAAWKAANPLPPSAPAPAAADPWSDVAVDDEDMPF